MPITEHTVKTRRHTTFYLAAGPENGPLVIFVHGWPELSISWRHQLPALAALGFRTIAPDMRGYGRSSVYPQHGDYAQENIVQDMLELVEAVGRKKAVWVGHDWGSPVVWNLASHHPDRCHAVANNEESFAEAIASMDANVYQFVKLLFRKGDPAGEGQRVFTATARRSHSFIGMSPIPDLPRDNDVVTEEDLSINVSALERNGFYGASSWYMNHGVNAEYAMTAQNGGYLAQAIGWRKRTRLR